MFSYFINGDNKYKYSLAPNRNDIKSKIKIFVIILLWRNWSKSEEQTELHKRQGCTTKYE